MLDIAGCATYIYHVAANNEPQASNGPEHKAARVAGNQNTAAHPGGGNLEEKHMENKSNPPDEAVKTFTITDSEGGEL